MKKILFFLFICSICYKSNAQNNDESNAIKKVLEKESTTWRSGDVMGHANCWAIKPYSRILVSTGDSAVLDIPGAFIVTPPEGVMGKGGTAVNSNYKMNISGSNAWVSHDEESTAADGRKTFSSEFSSTLTN